MSILGMEAGGSESVELLRSDLYNAIIDDEDNLPHDTEMLKEHFQYEVCKNWNFRFAIKEDEKGRLTHCFWADAISRQSYMYFGDVVVFDTTRNTNRYGMVFAPILGVNHHCKPVLFGCAFLNNDTSDSFEWLFKEWLKVMPAGPPKMIITDLNPEMKKAFAIVLPNTFHRYCIWHIFNKFSEKFGAVAYKELFQDCIWNSESAEEFERWWRDVLGKNNLAQNEWLDGMYRIRAQWIPVYIRNIFSAHMASSSQRVEISHAFFKRYISTLNSLFDFVTRFDWALEEIRENELQLDRADMCEKALKTPICMEEIFRDLYTQAIFSKCQMEIFECLRHTIQLSAEDEHILRFDVRRIQGIGERVRIVEVEKTSNKITCSCKMFEGDGILCRHVLAYFYRKDIVELPDQFIMRRWMKSAKAKRAVVGVGDFVGGCASLLLDRDDEESVSLKGDGLFVRANMLVGYATDDISIQAVEKVFHELEDKLGLVQICTIDESVNQASVTSCHSSSLSKESHQGRANGYSKRFKGEKEMPVKKSRRCHGCGLIGQSHDKRNCPQLADVPSINEHQREGR